MYLTLPFVDVKTANARPVHWAISTACVVPAVQFGHALGRHIGASRGEDLTESSAAGGVYPTSVRLVHHRSRVLKDRLPKVGTVIQKRRAAGPTLNLEQELNSKGKKTVGRVSDQPAVFADILVSMVLEFDDDDQIDELDIPDINSFVRRARIAGGQIIDHRPTELHDTLRDAMKSIGSGFVINERSDLIDPADPLRSMLDALYGDRLKPQGGASNDRAWLVPTCLGYVLAESRCCRNGVRFGLPHAYCEPLAGLVQYRSVRSYISENRDSPGWHSIWVNSTAWVVTQAGSSSSLSV